MSARPPAPIKPPITLEEIEGRQAIFFVNLGPKTMAGTLSDGMLIDIGYADGLTPVLAIPEAEVPDGTWLG